MILNDQNGCDGSIVGKNILDLNFDIWYFVHFYVCVFLCGAQNRNDLGETTIEHLQVIGTDKV